MKQIWRAFREWLWMPLLFVTAVALCGVLSFLLFWPPFADPRTLFGPPPPPIPLRLLLSPDDGATACGEEVAVNAAVCPTPTSVTWETPVQEAGP